MRKLINYLTIFALLVLTSNTHAEGETVIYEREYGGGYHVVVDQLPTFDGVDFSQSTDYQLSIQIQQVTMSINALSEGIISSMNVLASNRTQTDAIVNDLLPGTLGMYNRLRSEMNTLYSKLRLCTMRTKQCDQFMNRFNVLRNKLPMLKQEIDGFLVNLDLYERAIDALPKAIENQEKYIARYFKISKLINQEILRRGHNISPTILKQNQRLNNSLDKLQENLDGLKKMFEVTIESVEDIMDSANDLNQAW